MEPMILAATEVEKVLAACSGGRYSVARDQALIGLQYHCGLRPGEALGLRRGEIREVDGVLVVRVSRPKGHAREKSPTHPRELALGARAADLVRAWIKVRGDGPGPLFTNRSGAQLSDRYWRARFKRLGHRAGIEGRIHAHGLRHSAAHRFCRNHGVLLTQKFLGHSDVKTTLSYLTRIGSNEELVSLTASEEW